MITIIKQPYKFTPSNNPIIWTVTSDNVDIIYFRTELIETISNSTISFLDLYTTPDNVSGAYINLTKILSNLVKWEVVNDNSIFVAPITKSLLSYRLKITERIIYSGTGTIIDADILEDEDDLNYIWNATMDRITFNNYNQTNHVINATNSASFLTNKPNYSFQNDYSTEYLYFLNDGTMTDLKVSVNTYDSTSTLIENYMYAIPNLDIHNMFRIHASPKGLENGLLVDFADVNYYTIQILNADDIGKTELRTYNYSIDRCNIEPVNLIFANSLGGFDSYQFINPQETISINKTTIKKNIFDINQSGIYSDKIGDTYNPSEEIISINNASIIKVYSKQLSDNEAFWMSEIFSSKQVFVELIDNSLVPVMINTNSYQIQKTKYLSDTINIVQIEYSLSDGIIPSKMGAFGSGNGSAQIGFIDSQMYSIFNSHEGFNIL